MLRLLRPTDKLIQCISNAHILNSAEGQNKMPNTRRARRLAIVQQKVEDLKDCKTSKWMGTAATASYEQTLLNVSPTRVTVLDNGLRVATETTDSKTATVGLWIGTGSKFETAEYNGVGNFFEHIAFKGSNKRSQVDLELEVENLGAQLHAETGREVTSFYAKGLIQDVPKLVEILSDSVLNNKFNEDDIEVARSTILNELEELEFDNRYCVMDHIHTTAFSGTPLSQTVYGPTRNIQSLGKKDLINHVQHLYKAPRIVLAGAGGIEHEALVELAEKHLKGLSSGYDGPVPKENPVRFTAADMRVRDDDIPLAHIVLAVEGAGWTDQDRLPLTVASEIIGSWDNTCGGGINNSSFLAQTGAVMKFSECFQSFHTSYKDTGLWGLYMACDRLSINEFIWVAKERWMKICTGATDAEVERAKNALRTNLLLQLDGTTQTCDDIGKQLLSHGRRIPIHEMDAMIEEITAADVREACFKIIYNAPLAAAAIGPVEALKDLVNLQGGMYWIRT